MGNKINLKSLILVFIAGVIIIPFIWYFFTWYELHPKKLPKELVSQIEPSDSYEFSFERTILPKDFVYYEGTFKKTGEEIHKTAMHLAVYDTQKNIAYYTPSTLIIDESIASDDPTTHPEIVGVKSFIPVKRGPIDLTRARYKVLVYLSLNGDEHLVSIDEEILPEDVL